MPKRILVDASHSEETRVVILQNGRVEEFESETAIKEQLKGNIYLAKITRVEPSLQAAFVDYGGGRHGFLPFSEIHPDYYDIPFSDKQELLASLRGMNAVEDDIEEDESEENKNDNKEHKSVRRRKKSSSRSSAPEPADLDAESSDEHQLAALSVKKDMATDYKKVNADDIDDVAQDAAYEGISSDSAFDDADADEDEDIEDDDGIEDDEIEFDDAQGTEVSSGPVDVIDNREEDEINEKDRAAEVNLYKRYKIQEVIKRNKIILVQVEKEERGNKGASLTTFISIAGRYCVLMPKSLRHGGVSRRIGSYEDRKRLKQVIKQLHIPEEYGLIVRTAGAGKSAEQIRRDYDYLANLWNNIRDKTLESSAPAFIHAEGDIVKRVLRDWYNEQIDELLIEGEDAFKTAQEFVKEVMPEQTHCVKPYRSKVPIFSRYRIEEQIAGLFLPHASLESGGSLVIMPTEALISIDVNSGKLTNTRNVEDTATNTNLEAAREIARQLRLRNLSGLIVIDFIDMLELRNRKAVERELKMAFANDRARIQIGRISTFGLLEMSRQRMSPSFLEVNSIHCQACSGSGFLKAPGSIAANVLRAIEHEISRGGSCAQINVSVPSAVAVYILNHKRNRLTYLEDRYKVTISVTVNEEVGLEGFSIEKIRQANDGGSKGSDKETNDNTDHKGDRDAKEEGVNDNYKKGQRSKHGRKTSAERSNNERRDNDRPVKKEKISMFEGLWQKILD